MTPACAPVVRACHVEWMCGKGVTRRGANEDVRPLPALLERKGSHSYHSLGCISYHGEGPRGWRQIVPVSSAAAAALADITINIRKAAEAPPHSSVFYTLRPHQPAKNQAESILRRRR
jgi:hypothetical protein